MPAPRPAPPRASCAASSAPCPRPTPLPLPPPERPRDGGSRSGSGSAWSRGPRKRFVTPVEPDLRRGKHPLQEPLFGAHELLPLAADHVHRSRDEEPELAEQPQGTLPLLPA